MIGNQVKPKSIFNWSGGKDSSLCLHEVLKQNELEIDSLLTSVNAQYQRVSMHGVRMELLEKQAKSIEIPLKKLMVPEMPTMTEYDTIMLETMNDFKKQEVIF